MRYEHDIVSTLPSDRIYYLCFQVPYNFTIWLKIRNDAEDGLISDAPGDDAREAHYVAFGDP
jgi:hypothetical protein